MSRPIKLGILREDIKESEDVIGSLNYVFTRLIDANPDAEKLQVYILSANFYQPSEPPSLFGTPYKMYVGERIESKFLLFINGYRSSFIFSADILGWIKNPTQEQLDSVVPDNFPHTFGRTFREYFGQHEEIDGDHYYSMHCFYEGLENGIYKNRPNDPCQIDFWAFYDYFGKERVILDYEKPVKTIV